MADLNLNDQLKFRRKAMTTQTTIQIENVDDEEDHKRIGLNFEEDQLCTNLPPPPAPSPPKLNGDGMYRDQKKFDLRPENMKNDLNQIQGKPSISIIDNNELRNPLAALTAKEFINGRARLSKPQNEVKPISSEVVENTTRRKSLPADPVKGQAHKRRASNNDDSILTKKANLAIEIAKLQTQMKIEEDRIEAITKDEFREDHNTFEEPLKCQRRQSNFSERSEEIIEREDDDPIEPTRRDWERLLNMKSNSIKMLSNGKERSTKSAEKSVTAKEGTSKIESAPSEARSIRSIQLNGVMKRSRSRRAPSVCFSFPEGNDELSEVSADDIIDFEKQVPDHGTYGYISTELNVREPFNSCELNVLHAMCEEYRQIAELTFVKRLFQIRSLTPQERVYNFLGSRRRSKWLEKSDVVKGVMYSKVLDYLFTATIRSRSRTIRGYVLTLKGFGEGKTLSISRFSTIIKDAFQRRDYLFKCAVGDLKRYQDIK